MRRYWLLLLLVLLCPSVASAQGTLIPFIPQFFDTATGVPCSGCKLYSYAAGTTTPQATYFDQDLDITHINANPVVMTTGGRPTTGYIYLSATSYKFILQSAANVTIWTVDNANAIPTTTAFLDVQGIAGEALSAGEATYLSDGSGGQTAGRWYKADADFTYASTTATQVGMAPTAIASAATGSIRLGGRVSGLSGLTAGEDYFVSATAGALTSTPPANARFVGRADTTTSLDMSGGAGVLRTPDSDGTHKLVIKTTSDLTADRLLTIVPGDAARTVTLSGNPTLSDWFDQSVKTGSGPSFATPAIGAATGTSLALGTTLTTNSKLTVYHSNTNVDTDQLLHLRQASTGDVGIEYSIDGVTNWVSYVDNSDSDKFKIGANNGGTADRFILTTGGALQLNNYGAGTATFDGSGNITSVSDPRVKQDVAPAPYGLSHLLKLNTIQYRYTPESGLDTKETYVGFDAKNVNEVMPLATGHMADGLLTLQDRAILATAVKALQELTAENEALRARVDRLEQERAR